MSEKTEEIGYGILTKEYFKRLSAINTKLDENLNEILKDKAYDILMKFQINSDDENKDLKYGLLKKRNESGYIEYIFEVFNTYQKSKTLLGLALTMLEEAEIKYNISSEYNYTKNIIYLNTLLYYVSLYFECCTNYIHSFFDKLGQFLNIYFEIGLNEDKLYFTTVINRMVKINLADTLNGLGLNTASLGVLLNFNEFNVGEIQIFNESYKMRKKNVHKLSVLNEGLIFSPMDIYKYRKILEANFDLASKSYNSLNEFIVENNYLISLYYFSK